MNGVSARHACCDCGGGGTTTDTKTTGTTRTSPRTTTTDVAINHSTQQPGATPMPTTTSTAKPTPKPAPTCAPLQKVACGPGQENEIVVLAGCPSSTCVPCKDGSFKGTTGTEGCQAKLSKLLCTQNDWRVFTAGSNTEKTTDDARCACKAKTGATKVVCPRGMESVGKRLDGCDGWGCEPCDATTGFKPASGTQACTLKRTTCPQGEFFTPERSITTADQTKCTPCPDGMFKTGTNGATVCAAKRTSCPWNRSPVIFHPGENTQKTHDDSKCFCPDGMHSNVPDTTKATSCIAKRTMCPAGQWFQSGKAGVKDRDDTTCFTCAAGKYQAGGRQFTSCLSKKTSCSQGQSFTAGSDNERTKDDTTCTPCPNGQYLLSITTCTPKLSSCGEGRYLDKGTDSQKATDDARCLPCGVATFKAGTNGATSCQPQPKCSQGQKISAASSVATRVCTTCPPNTFQPAANHRSTTCFPWRAACDSSIGESETRVPTPSNNRECVVRRVECTAAEFEVKPALGGQQRECQAISTCTEGLRVLTAATTTSDLVCGDCPPDTYQDQDVHTLQTCTPQTACQAGEFLSPDSKAAARICTPCPGGMFQTKDDHRETACTPKTQQCPPGELMGAGEASVLTKDDARCTPCGEHEYKTEASAATECGAQPTCGNGTFISPSSTVVRQTCTSCPQGTFRGEANHRHEACLPWSSACTRQGQFEAQPPTPSTNRACGTTGDCQSDEFESKMPTATTSRECTAISACGKNEKAVIKPGRTNDVKCAPCEAGTELCLSRHRLSACFPIAKTTSSPPMTATAARTDSATAVISGQGQSNDRHDSGQTTLPNSTGDGSTDSNGSSDSSGSGVIVVVVVAVLLVMCGVAVGVVACQRRNKARTAGLATTPSECMTEAERRESVFSVNNPAFLTHGTRAVFEEETEPARAHIRDGSGSLQVVSGQTGEVGHGDYDDINYEKMAADRGAVSASAGLASHNNSSASSPNTRAKGVGTLGRDAARLMLQPELPDTTDAGGNPVDYLPLGNTQIGTYAAAADTVPTYEVVEDVALGQQRPGGVVVDSPYTDETETDDVYSVAADTGIVTSGTSAIPEGVYSKVVDVAEDTVPRRPPCAVAQGDNTLPRVPTNTSDLERRRSVYNGFAEVEDA